MQEYAREKIRRFNENAKKLDKETKELMGICKEAQHPDTITLICHDSRVSSLYFRIMKTEPGQDFPLTSFAGLVAGSKGAWDSIGKMFSAVTGYVLQHTSLRDAPEKFRTAARARGNKDLTVHIDIVGHRMCGAIRALLQRWGYIKSHSHSETGEPDYAVEYLDYNFSRGLRKMVDAKLAGKNPRELDENELWDLATKEAVRFVAKTILEEHDYLKEAFKSGKLRLNGFFFDQTEPKLSAIDLSDVLAQKLIPPGLKL